jgi:hypothetical protein
VGNPKLFSPAPEIFRRGFVLTEHRATIGFFTVGILEYSVRGTLYELVLRADCGVFSIVTRQHVSLLFKNIKNNDSRGID